MITANAQYIQEKDVVNKYHPIVYFLIVLLKYDSTKSTKCYLLLKNYLEMYNVKIQDEVDEKNIIIEENEIKNIDKQLNNIKL